MRYLIEGANKVSGEDCSVVIEAPDAKSAELAAQSKGVLISSIKEIGIASPIPPNVGNASSGLATASLITGIPGICCFPAGIVAIVLGIIALNDIKKFPEKEKSKGFAVAGIVLGGVSILFLFIGLFTDRIPSITSPAPAPPSTPTMPQSTYSKSTPPRHESELQSISGSDDGNAWKRTSYEAKMSLCSNIARTTQKHDANYYYYGLDAFYTTRDQAILKQRISEVAAMLAVQD